MVRPSAHERQGPLASPPFGTNFDSIPRHLAQRADPIYADRDRPLSWVIFNSGDHRIVFSNTWFLTLDTEQNDVWRLDLGDGGVLTYPPR